MAGFIVRLVGYALLLGLASRAAQNMWTQYGLEGVAELGPFYHAGTFALLVAPVVLALAGSVRPLRSLAVFAGFFLAGAALTAPFVCARVSGV